MRMILSAGRVSAIEHQRALLARSVFYTAVREFFDTYDLLLTPQMPVAAWSAEPGPDEGVHEIAGQPAPTMFDRLPFTYPFNLTGQPAASVPCGFTREGLPVGLQIVGRWHADAQVLRAAACFEAVQPWAQHRPPLDDVEGAHD
jgi:aspartyl-tRNA(Asn)/glutamyl-tRNA(Gln) amidotransferase subunit A